MLRVEPGWNFLHFPFELGTFLTVRPFSETIAESQRELAEPTGNGSGEKGRLVWFSVDGAAPWGSTAASTRTGLDIGGRHWIWSDEPLRLEFGGVGFPAVSSSLVPEDPWQVTELKSNLGWDAQSQAYAPIPVGATLEPGQGLKERVASLAVVLDAGDSTVQPSKGIDSEQDDPLGVGEAVEALMAYAPLNYKEAIEARDGLLRSGVQTGLGEINYQVEYEGVPDSTDALWVQGALEDAQHLAEFDRVWAYTQGVALAQYARQTDDFKVSRGVARFLCERAQWNEEKSKILGWPFSWNTLEPWRDMRLVTGATAWAIHGLGRFLSSQAFDSLASAEEQRWLQDCYIAALFGLVDHRRTVYLKDGKTVDLVSAGWTAAGLRYASEPSLLTTEESRFLGSHESELWSYYSVLDGIGYDAFEPFEIKFCTQGWACELQRGAGGLWRSRLIDSEEVWSALRVRVSAPNVVTEHNLDVLGVLNHAIDHSEAFGLPTSGVLSRDALEEWRNRLRDGIFYGLWDAEGWKSEFRQVLATTGEASVSTSEEAVHREWARRQAMERALTEDSLGRVVTGGELYPEGPGGFSLQVSSHTAIDNCSWLSLSVDYEDLEHETQDGGAIYIERLAQCLEYTVLRFVKDLGFDEGHCAPTDKSCLAVQTYIGAHYFQNAFKDPYIAPSEAQESSYHLEATMGLVLGLLRFSEALPAHPSAPRFSKAARALWAGAQGFVREHGFPYSSQRIHNLSTQLTSSTSILWFIEVYEHLEKKDAPWAENIEFVLPKIVDGVLEEKFVESGVPQDVVTEFGGRLLLASPKLALRHGAGAVRWLDEVAKLPAGWTLGALAGLNTTLFWGTAQVDLGLETILLSSDAPSTVFWERVGVVRSEEFVVQPAGSHARDESDIRAHLQIYPDEPLLDRPLSNPPIAFDEEAIYLVQVDWLGLELPYGHFGVLTSSKERLWSVFRLKTDRPRFEILEDFVKNHKYWKHLSPYAESLPEAQRATFLYIVELVVRGEFNVVGAETLGGSNETLKFDFPLDKVPVPWVLRPEGARLGFPSVRREQMTALFEEGSIWNRKPTRRILIYLYQVDRATQAEISKHLGRAKATGEHLRSLVDSGFVNRETDATGTTHYSVALEKTHAFHRAEVDFFWRQGSKLDALVGSEPLSVSERARLATRLIEYWNPLISVLAIERSRFFVALLQEYESISYRELNLFRPISVDSFRGMLKPMLKTRLVERTGTPLAGYRYHLNPEILLQFHYEWRRFLWRMRAPQVPRLHGPGGQAPLSGKERRLIEMVASRTPVVDPLWGDREKRTLLVHLYGEVHTVSALRRRAGLTLESTKASLDELGKEGLLDLVSENASELDHFTLSFLDFHRARQEELKLFWDDAPDKGAFFSQSPIAMTTEDALIRRLVEYWDSAIVALNMPASQLFALVLHRRGDLGLSDVERITGLPARRFKAAAAALERAGLIQGYSSGGQTTYRLNVGRLFQLHHETYWFLSRAENLLDFSSPLKESNNAVDVRGLPRFTFEVSERHRKLIAALRWRRETTSWWSSLSKREIVLTLYNKGPMSFSALAEFHGSQELADFLTQLQENGVVRSVDSEGADDVLVLETELVRRTHLDDLRLFWGTDEELRRRFSRPKKSESREVLSDRLRKKWHDLAVATSRDTQRIILLLLGNNEALTKEVLKQAVSAGTFHGALSRMQDAGLVVDDGGKLRLNRDVLLEYHRDLYHFFSKAP